MHDQEQIQHVENAVINLENTSTSFQRIVSRSVNTVDALLFSDTSAAAMFAVVDEHQAWKPKNPMAPTRSIYTASWIFFLDYSQSQHRLTYSFMADSSAQSGGSNHC
jgi:hypothetical protein